MVIVLDKISANIVSHLFTITELVEIGIVFVETLEVNRKPLQHHALYFITPTQTSIRHMLKDF